MNNIIPWWLAQPIRPLYSFTDSLLFYGQVSNISNGKLYNEVTGASDYLIVTGTPGSYTFQCPNTAEYMASDTDYIWFKIDGTRRTATEAELVGYDLQKTPVKYDNDTPNSLRAIAILKGGGTLTAQQKTSLQLPIMWGGTWDDAGFNKYNRSIVEQQLWTPESVLSSCIISDADRNKLAVTFQTNLDESSVPATTAFSITGKTVSGVSIAGSVLTLTIATTFEWTEVVTFGYTKPATNMLKSVLGATYSSFTSTVTNNITYPTFFADGNSKIWKDNTDASTITKDASNYVSRINHKLGGAIYFTASGTGKPQLGANGDLAYDGIDDSLGASASVGLSLPITMYFVFRNITHAYPRAYVGWNPSYQTGFLTAGDNLAKVYHGATSASWALTARPALNIAVMKIQGANSTISINGGADVVFDSGSSAGGFTVLSIFSNANGFLSGVERELIFRSGADTPENRLLGYNYLKAKHGL